MTHDVMCLGRGRSPSSVDRVHLEDLPLRLSTPEPIAPNFTSGPVTTSWITSVPVVLTYNYPGRHGSRQPGCLVGPGELAPLRNVFAAQTYPPLRGGAQVMQESGVLLSGVPQVQGELFL